MNSHQDVQDAFSRERNPPVNGNNNVPHQVIQSLQKKTLHKMISHEQEATPSHEQVDHTQDDPMGEEVVDLWEAEDVPDEDYVVEQVTRSHQIPGSCMRQASFVLDMKMAVSSLTTM